MPTKPFIYTAQVVLGAAGSGTWSVQIGAGEKALFRHMMYASTGAFSITAIRDSSNNPFGNVKPGSPVPSTLLSNKADGVPAIGQFDPPIEIEGPRSLNIDLLDTSGAANTVTIAFEASVVTGGG